VNHQKNGITINKMEAHARSLSHVL